jgi:hypothetical protein
MAELGLPDWRIRTEYPDPDSTTVREWWWEFTRRRPDYRQAWVDAAPNNKWGYRCAADVDAWRLKFEMSVIYDPSQSFTDWELMQMRYPANAGWQPSALDPKALNMHNSRKRAEAAHGLYRYSFDLTRPLSPQIERAKRQMALIQAELYPSVTSRRLLKKLWPDYLRALDARDNGATYAEIAAELNPLDAESEFWARDRCEAAIRLRDNFPI